MLQLLFNTILTFTKNHIFSIIIQNRTIGVASTCTQGQTRKKAHKSSISQIALKLQS